MPDNNSFLDTAVNDITLSRRSLLSRAGGAGLGLATMGLLAAKEVKAHGNSHDALIVSAAATAEALATTMYYNIINSDLYMNGLSSNANDQAYLVAGFEQELNHYKLLSSVAPALATKFYFPPGMFGDPTTYATTINTLVTLEDAFIAAYLIGVRDLSTPGLKVLAAQIMGVEAEHRAFGRVIAADLGFTSVTGLSGKAEGVNGPNFAANNLAYERRFQPGLDQITDVINALVPFIDPTKAGFVAAPVNFAAASATASAGQTYVTLAATAP